MRGLKRPRRARVRRRSTLRRWRLEFAGDEVFEHDGGTPAFRFDVATHIDCCDPPSRVVPIAIPPVWGTGSDVSIPPGQTFTTDCYAEDLVEHLADDAPPQRTRAGAEQRRAGARRQGPRMGMAVWRAKRCARPATASAQRRLGRARATDGDASREGSSSRFDTIHGSIAHGNEDDDACPRHFRSGFTDELWSPHRTPRRLHNPSRMNNLQEPQNFRHPFRSQFRSGLNHTLRDYMGRLRTDGAQGARAYSPLTNAVYMPLRNSCARMLATTEGNLPGYALVRRPRR